MTTFTHAGPDGTTAGGAAVAPPASEQQAPDVLWRNAVKRRQQLARLASCTLWWIFTLGVAASPWWAPSVGQAAENAFVRSHAFLVAQLAIAAALLLFNLLGAPWRVVPHVRNGARPSDTPDSPTFRTGAPQ